jgi:hypothetical protein
MMKIVRYHLSLTLITLATGAFVGFGCASNASSAPKTGAHDAAAESRPPGIEAGADAGHDGGKSADASPTREAGRDGSSLDAGREGPSTEGGRSAFRPIRRPIFPIRPTTTTSSPIYARKRPLIR